MLFACMRSHNLLYTLQQTFREGNRQMADQTLDTKGLNCPIPIVKAKKALADMSGGQVLEVLATDPGAVKDFEVFAKQTGNALLSSTEEDGRFVFLMKKS